MITGVVYSIYRDVILWDTVWNALQGLENLRQHYESSILVAQRLPKDYRQALSHFTHLLNEVIEGMKKRLHLTSADCPPFRHYFIKQVQGPDDPFIRVKARTNVNDHLWWLLEQLQRDDRVEICGLPSLLDETERLVGSDSKQREQLSPRMARALSDLSILAGLQRQIALSSPGGLIASAVPPPELSSRMVETMKPVWSVWQTTMLDMRVGKFGLDLNLFSYPADKRQNAKLRRKCAVQRKIWICFWQRSVSISSNTRGRS